jgi:hypothetical protein
VTRDPRATARALAALATCQRRPRAPADPVRLLVVLVVLAAVLVATLGATRAALVETVQAHARA